MEIPYSAPPAPRKEIIAVNLHQVPQRVKIEPSSYKSGATTWYIGSAPDNPLEVGNFAFCAGCRKLE